MLFNKRYGKIQVIMALTLDGFLPHEDEMLMRWVRENKRYGFPRWQRQATFHIYPHYGLMDLLNVKENTTRIVFIWQEWEIEEARNMPMDFFGIIWWMRQYFSAASFLWWWNPLDGRIPVCPLETSWLQNFLQRNLPAYV